MAALATRRGKGKGHKENPAVSPEQYRLAQAVLSGTARTSHMPVKVARELVERTPAKLRSEWSHKNPGAEKVYLWGYHRIRGVWEKLQGPSDTVTMEQYKPYFEKTTLAQSYAGVPYSGFANDSRPTYTQFVIAGKAPRKRNPESAAASMYSSFHGTPSTAVDEYEEKEHYHSNLAALGELVGLKVRTVSGYDVTLGFESSTGRESNPKLHGHHGDYDLAVTYKVIGAGTETFLPTIESAVDKAKILSKRFGPAYRFDVYGPHGYAGEVHQLNGKIKLSPSLQQSLATGGRKHNPPTRRTNLWPFDSFSRTTIMHVPSGHKFHTTTRHKGHTIYKSETKEGYVVPEIERDSVFDSVKDAKKFIDHWVKGRTNPKRRQNYSADNIIAETPYREDAEEAYEEARQMGIDAQMSRGTGADAYYHIVTIPKKDVDRWKARHERKNPKGKRHSATGPFASSQQFVGDTIGAIYRPMNDFLGYAGGLADKGLGKVGIKGNPYHWPWHVSSGLNVDRTKVFEGPNAKEEAFAYAQQEADSTGWTAYVRKGTPGSMAKSKQYKVKPSSKSNPRKRSNPDHVLLCSTEDGQNLQLIGGDQSLDLDSLKITGPLAEKELVTVGEVWGLNYRTEKVFGDGGSEDGLTEYIHILGPKETKPPRGGDLWADAVPPRDTTFGTGELPTLVYDKRNQKLTLSGGMYHINQPVMGTSPGIEN